MKWRVFEGAGGIINLLDNGVMEVWSLQNLQKPGKKNYGEVVNLKQRSPSGHCWARQWGKYITGN